MVSEKHCKKIKSYQKLTVLFVVPCMIEQCIGVVAAAGQKQLPLLQAAATITAAKVATAAVASVATATVAAAAVAALQLLQLSQPQLPWQPQIMCSPQNQQFDYKKGE